MAKSVDQEIIVIERTVCCVHGLQTEGTKHIPEEAPELVRRQKTGKKTMARTCTMASCHSEQDWVRQGKQV